MNAVKYGIIGKKKRRNKIIMRTFLAACNTLGSNEFQRISRSIFQYPLNIRKYISIELTLRSDSILIGKCNFPSYTMDK